MITEKDKDYYRGIASKPENASFIFDGSHNPRINLIKKELAKEDYLLHRSIKILIGINSDFPDENGKNLSKFFELVSPLYGGLKWNPICEEEPAKNYSGETYNDIAKKKWIKEEPVEAISFFGEEDPLAVTTDAEAIEEWERFTSRANSLLRIYKIATEHDLTGPVMVIGGAEDKTTHSEILKEFFKLAGGKGCDISIVTWASRKSDAGKNYQKIFKSLGANDVFLIKKKDKEEAEDFMKRSAGIFFVGGDQMRLITAIEELNLKKIIHSCHKSGAAIGGTSAGASILGEHMPYWDLEKEKMIYHKGLALIPNSIIDQHYTQRNRVERMRDGVKRFKGITGYGLDEDTGLVFVKKKSPKKIGKGKIHIMKSE
jgi:cyanophycinase